MSRLVEHLHSADPSLKELGSLLSQLEGKELTGEDIEDVFHLIDRMDKKYDQEDIDLAQEHAFATGHEEGQDEGKAIGYKDGFDEGYQEGYEIGLEEADSKDDN